MIESTLTLCRNTNGKEKTDLRFTEKTRKRQPNNFFGPCRIGRYEWTGQRWDVSLKSLTTENRALFTSKNFYKIKIIVFLFVFDKYYYLIMN